MRTWPVHLFACLGIVLLTWLAFGSVFRDLGHRGDSWGYMLRFTDEGLYSILEVQPSRLALPWAWAVGFWLAGTQAWIYHLINFVFLTGSALCLYALLVIMMPGRRLFAFSVAVLATLWPADPTRYDIATLGNRQAHFFLMAGALLYLLAWRGARRAGVLSVAALALLAASLLTYEAHLFLIGVLPLITLLDERRISVRWLRSLLVPAGVMLIFGAVNVVTTFSGAGESYRRRLWVTGPTQFVQQLTDGVQVLLVQSWSLPVELLRDGGVPRLGLVLGGTALFAVWIAVLTWWEAHHRSPRQRDVPVWRMLAISSIAVPLSLAVFALSTIAMSQPDRTQTYSLVAGAVLLCAVLRLVAGKLPADRLVYAVGCTVFVGLSLSMAMVYQRNYVDSWREQRIILAGIVEESPDIAPDTITVIHGLPDTRIIFVSGYTCTFSLLFLFGYSPQPSHLIMNDIDSGSSRSVELPADTIYCGLLFSGRNIDPAVSVEFREDGVLYRRERMYERFFTYDRVLLYEYSDQDGVRLLRTIPESLVPPHSNADQYAPHALGGGPGVRQERLRALEP